MVHNVALWQKQKQTNKQTKQPSRGKNCAYRFVSFLLPKSEQVMESEEFMLLPANQLIDIISSDELNVRSEEQVFNAVMAWVKYSIQERRPQLPQVRGKVLL